MIRKTYRELMQLNTYEERLRYLMLNSSVGRETFGFDRYLNQAFYRSQDWKSIRNKVIIRDSGCDLGLPGRIIHGRVLIHHMNPLTEEDLIDRTDFLMNPDYLITVSHKTHNAIHYGDMRILNELEQLNGIRTPGDTTLWRR